MSLTATTETLYASQDELTAALAQSSIDQLTIEVGGSQDSILVKQVLADASRVVDGYLGGRYVVPVTHAGAKSILRPHTLAIAKSMFLERRFAGKYDQAAQDARFASEKWLGMVAKKGGASVAGLTDLSAGDGTNVLTAGSNVPIFSDPDAVTGGLL
jgi:phage gp36-like protein